MSGGWRRRACVRQASRPQSACRSASSAHRAEGWIAPPTQGHDGSATTFRPAALDSTAAEVVARVPPATARNIGLSPMSPHRSPVGGAAAGPGRCRTRHQGRYCDACRGAGRSRSAPLAMGRVRLAAGRTRPARFSPRRFSAWGTSPGTTTHVCPRRQRWHRRKAVPGACTTHARGRRNRNQARLRAAQKAAPVPPVAADRAEPTPATPCGGLCDGAPSQ